MNKLKTNDHLLKNAVSGSVTLISMVDFIHIVGNKDESTFRENLSEIYNYAMLLKRKLELWMFVPCDENNIPLKEPVMSYSQENIKRLKGIEIEIAELVNRKISEYQYAKKKCLFEGFKYQDVNEDFPMPFVYLDDDITLYPETFDERDNIEDLVYYSDFIKLSNTALNIIGLTDNSLTDR
jgi:hypothetical protein